MTALQRTTISEVRRRLGAERAQAHAAANATAVDRVAELVEDLGIDCEFTRAPACTFTASDD